MPNTEIILMQPKYLFTELLAWNDRLWSIPDETEIVLDFRDVQFSFIFALTFMAHQIRSIQLKRKGTKVNARNTSHLTWVEGMNFFLASGIDWGSKLQARVGDGFNYIPITLIDCRSGSQRRDLVEMNEDIDREAEKIAHVLLHLGSGSTFDTIQYAFREIIRNVYEHSGSRVILIAGQYYPANKNAQIIIADSGMGIPNSLRFNPAFKDLSDPDALNLALMPGVSGNARALATPSANIWQNSGYGLYLTTRLARNSGFFRIISSSAVVELSRGTDPQRSKRNYRIGNFHGTMIRLGLDLSSKENFGARLARYAEEGKEIAREIKGAKVLDASTASLLLRRDFDRARRG